MASARRAGRRAARRYAGERRVVDAVRQKPLLKRSYRPPNFETPVDDFNELITPNDRFFVRWHLSSIPEVDEKDWRLAIGGDSLERPFELTLE